MASGLYIASSNNDVEKTCMH